MQQWIKEIARGKRGSNDLTYEQAKQAAKEIGEGKATDAQVAAFFIAQRLKTEMPDELLAFVDVFSALTNKIDLEEDVKKRTIDFASPYAGRNSFFATIPVSVLLAERGIPAFLHCSEALPPKFGVTIADVLNELLIHTDKNAQQIKHDLTYTNIGFAQVEQFSPPLSVVKHIRHEIGVRTLINTAEKLLNLSGATSIMMGAFHRTAINKIAPIFESLSFDQVYIVQGVEGSEDVPVHRNSFVYKIINGEMESFIVNPKEYHLYVEEEKFNKNIPVQTQADMILSILNGEKDEKLEYAYNQVVFNAGLRYYLFGYNETIEEGINYAKKQLESKVGYKKLQEWKSNHY
ncbi:anthranilate phosphoribosyltransferase [Metabacillus iocasae]|uniref:Anthranilate phosphoribosyltransferase n=1 Tax=Priestia iocasae TaxID=2291674 RepID=A0ABS2QWI8_9BACI|nr:anthranilate phosphoribosyltransferase [Metabacillus iocasae]MBM7703821.1 anthranilate phosphoribosyltransferase [Metabacillus iocasae]